MTSDETSEFSPEIVGDEAPPVGLRVRHWLFTVAPLVAWTVASLIRVTVADRFPYVATVFYATPLLLLVGLAAFLTLRLRRLGWNRAAAFLALCALLQISVWRATTAGHERPTPPETTLRIAFWNVSRGDFGYEQVARQVNAFDADIVAVSEAVDDGQSVGFWSQHCPEFSAVPLSSGMTLLVRGEAAMIEHDRAGPVCRWRIARVTCRGVQMNVGIVDFTSNPLLFRKLGFEALQRVFEAYDDQPFILTGDFNTPIESVFSGRLRECGTNAFEASGEGLRETWPVFAPLLTLDQLWGNSQIEWHRCRHLWSLRSDHRPVVAEFEIVAPAGE